MLAYLCYNGLILFARTSASLRKSVSYREWPHGGMLHSDGHTSGADI